MPDLIQSKYAKGTIIQPYPRGAGDVVVVRATLEATTAMLAAGNIFEMMAMPENCRPVDMVLITDDLDSDGTPAITFDVGLMSGEFGDDDDTRTCGAEFFDAATTGQAAGAARMSLATGFELAPSAVTRGIGVKVDVAPDVAVAGTITLIAHFAVAD